MYFMSGKEYTAKSIEEALERALNEMMLTREDIEYEVVQEPAKGFFGIGRKDAVVRVRKKVIKTLTNIVADLREERQPETTNQQQKAAPAKTNTVDAAPKVAAKVETAKPKEKEAEASEKAAQSTVLRETKTVTAGEEKVEKKPETKSEAKIEAKETAAQQEVAQSEEESAAKAIEKENALHTAEQKGREFLRKIFAEMDLDVTIDVKEKSGYLIFDLQGENLGILIGRRGDTLDSLQFLLNLVINDKNSPKIKGIVDVEHYRARREETLISLSHKLAAKARKTGQKVVLEPMNPQERRIIHMALQNDKRVSTYSEGEEPYRKVIIVPELSHRENRRREPRGPKETKQES